MKITYDGLVAGERFLRDHCDGFDDGTGNGFHVDFIKDLLKEVFRASGIDYEILVVKPEKPPLNALEGHQDTDLLLVFVAAPADADCVSGFVFHPR